MPAKLLEEQLRISLDQPQTSVFDDPGAAYRQACKTARPGDLILVTGSFYTVSEIRGKLLE
jgi:folylpolyglutamate synthase/dihydropteroate synthase